jgi:flavin-dependent dehydrogenase
LFDEFISLNPNIISSFRFFSHSDKNIFSQLGFNAFGLRRSLFDNLLLSNAKKKGINIFQPAEVKKIIYGNNFYELLIETDEHKELKIKVTSLIAAYGKQNYLDNHLKRDFVFYKSKLNGIKFHLNGKELKDFPEDEIQIYAADNIYCGVNRVDSNVATLCFLENRKTEQAPPRKQLSELQKKNKAFSNLFNGARKNLFDNIPVYGTGNIYFGKRNLVENGIFMIGDAAGVIAPLAGDGIGIAMESGKLAADLLFKRKKEKLSISETEANYMSSWKKLFTKRMKTAIRIQNIIFSRFGREAGSLIIKLFPSLLPILIKSTRNFPGK